MIVTWDLTGKRRKCCRHEGKGHNMDKQPVCWTALLQLWPSQLSEDRLCPSYVPKSYLGFCSITFTQKICLCTLANFPIISTILKFQHSLLWGQFLLLRHKKPIGFQIMGLQCAQLGYVLWCFRFTVQTELVSPSFSFLKVWHLTFLMVFPKFSRKRKLYYSQVIAQPWYNKCHL